MISLNSRGSSMSAMSARTKAMQKPKKLEQSLPMVHTFVLIHLDTYTKRKSIAIDPDIGMIFEEDGHRIML